MALVIAIYALGRRLMPPSFALLGALLLAVAAPRTHMMHAIYGYRYLVFCVLALLAFDRRLATGNPRWMLAAGLATGLAFFFRYDPASALVVALVIGVIASDRSPRVWLREGALVRRRGPAGGASGVDLVRLDGRPAALLLRSSDPPAPDAASASGSRADLPQRLNRVAPGDASSSTWSSDSTRCCTWPLRSCSGAGLLRAARERRGFEEPLLLATVVWGGIYFIRSYGRADEPHLDSAIPPVCLLLAVAAHRAYRHWPRRGVQTAIVIGGFALWIYLLGVDLVFRYPYSEWVAAPGQPLTWSQQKRIDKIEEWSKPGERVLDLTASPMLLVASDRLGPGYRDVVMPGTFADGTEEGRFLGRLESSPPALVLWPLQVFDAMPERSIRRSAPRVVKWVLSRYEMHAFDDEIAFLLPNRPGEPPTVEDLTGKGRTMTTAPRKRAGTPAELRR